MIVMMMMMMMVVVIDDSNDDDYVNDGYDNDNDNENDGIIIGTFQNPFLMYSKILLSLFLLYF